MDSKHLRSFLHIAELGSLSQAAARLDISQPALSRQLKALEDSAGSRLLHRTGRGVQLTEAGEILAERARIIIDEMEKLSSELAGLQGEVRGALCIGFPPTAGSRLAGPVVEAFHKRYPNVQLRVVQLLSGALERALLEERIDMGILYKGALSANLSTELLWQESMQLIAPPDTHPINGDYPEIQGNEISLTDALKLPQILPNRPHGLRALLEREAFRNNQPLNTVIEAESMQIQIELARRGLGYTVMPEGIKLPEEVRTLKISKPGLQRQCLLAWSKDHPLSNAGKAMRTILQQHIEDIKAG
ncbi:LysR family transcriptional regulator [Aliamphritea spongicola]|uniref:LysR family transcriptional regulator n=1 Tax=Aliamphritea spongicola TaxID=707589 RepID=UPI00196AA5DA|nr:LysR family transcriptional regulator [Aliamphritea spongicola]MBN3561255.1 LysR family transcriptional regulator [Aliamphritea spongicola]